MERARIIVLITFLFLTFGFIGTSRASEKVKPVTPELTMVSDRQDLTALAKEIISDDTMALVLQKAREVLRGGFGAGGNYPQVWIRDFNTFIELSLEVNDPEQIRKNLLTFFDFQGLDGNIPDGFVHSKDVVNRRYDFRTSPTRPGYLAHKNTVETDQETSLILAISRYIRKTGDRSIIKEEISGKTVKDRLDLALEYLMEHRFSEEYGLLIGATTIDWGDVQPEHEWGTFVTEDTHWCIDIYDNAMFVMALKEYLNTILADSDSTRHQKWTKVLEQTKNNIRKHLWNGEKFIPHIYLEDSPFPYISIWNENEVYYHGGTVAAIMAGLLSTEEIRQAFKTMISNKEKANSMSIGLTVYPPYPKNYFLNPDHQPYIYINGGDWTWWGGRAIQAMVQTGLIEQAYNEMYPMLRRVIENDGFYEWYSVKDHRPHGSGDFLGAAGALGKSIVMLRNWAKKYLGK